MNRGYSSRFIETVKAADNTKLGVRLGIVCIQNNISAVEVAEFFKVSRMTVYNWFKGKCKVPEVHEDKMLKLVEKLSF